MTTRISDTSVIFPNGTTQSTAAINPPIASPTAPGVFALATIAEAQNKWNDSKYYSDEVLFDAAIFGTGGYPQTWQNFTAKRATNVTYTNTSKRGIMVTLTSVLSGNQTYAGLIVNGVQVNYVGGDQDDWGATVCATAIVPPGMTYSANTPFSAWYELRR